MIALCKHGRDYRAQKLIRIRFLKYVRKVNDIDFLVVDDDIDEFSLGLQIDRSKL